MISTAPLRRLMCERDLTFQVLSMASGIDERTLSLMSDGKCITQKNINILCKVLNCQPENIIEYVKTCDYCEKDIKEFNYCPMCGRKF